jgi:hypothetical protein
LCRASGGDETIPAFDETVFKNRRRWHETSIGYAEPTSRQWTTPMLAEKFILLLETLRSQTHADGSPRVISTSAHIPVKLPSDASRPR